MTGTSCLTHTPPTARRGAIAFDADLVVNTRRDGETRVNYGMRLGAATRLAPGGVTAAAAGVRGGGGGGARAEGGGARADGRSGVVG
ncbi:hypothetical protein HXX76_013513 [Chlamydomonas incerta]|uniref:Uncharacterized protein n=1 Tax=Chlamydomonas incerta TaxID=51695 RepID=A0A835SHJ3_CHLIN|nr:hypothetical protein HXX76_013513 [Chlamydomonas incerta]|eukprot:KAG2425671.1 hypothetical protein HXX76_013513 [Chlamydomonas incerta]